MNKRQIFTLGLIAAVVLVIALLLNPHTTPITTQYFDMYRSIGFQNSSSSTPVEVSGGSIHGGSDFPVVSGKSDSPPSENIAPRAPSEHAVHMKIVAPDGASEFEVDLRDGEDLCENIEEAKSEGHIRSLTMDNSYLETFGSRYVREINGYSNNWTVKVNDYRPEGCSLYTPKAGDTIIWTFGV